jgi:hypothetical protein
MGGRIWNGLRPVITAPASADPSLRPASRATESAQALAQMRGNLARCQTLLYFDVPP